MTVDLEAIARRGRCDVSSLQMARPLLEQGYLPPFLARYRRDELGGVNEASLWMLAEAVGEEKATADRRDELIEQWQQTPLADPAIGHAIRKSYSKRILERIARRLKLEASERVEPAMRLAVRVLNPQKGDGGDLDALAASVDGVDDVANAVEGIDDALQKRLTGDPRVMSAAVRWLAKHAKIHVASINDPHVADDQPQADKNRTDSKDAVVADVAKSAKPDAEVTADTKTDSAVSPENEAPSSAVMSESVATEPGPTTTSEATDAPNEVTDATDKATETPSDTPADEPTSAEAVGVQPKGAELSVEETSAEATPSDAATAESSSVETAGDTPTAESAAAEDVKATPGKSPKKKGGKPSAASKSAGKAPKKPKKKISPRQRRRRWLVSVLKPLAGKRIAANKLSSFQVVMLGRALRSQVAQCAFEYDATKLVAELQRTVGGFNRHLSEELSAIVLEHEATIREAAESAWWDELHERASSRLVGIAADHLRRHVNRGNVDAKVVMSIDAVGPRTAATAIVAADGRLLHCEDLPCQLSQALRSQSVARMGELIHTHHVDLIVISNGPSRRACMVATGDLIKQSPEKSIRWTLADRSGADVYAGSGVADQEMRGTPRRFRAAAWLAFSVLQPAQAFTKVDPLKLRLASFQRELSDEALARTLESIMISGASRGGVDVNSSSVAWLARLPGVTQPVAESIDESRRESLFKSREAIKELEQWQSEVESRQALPFLRVFESEETLDGTLIHPEDYALAKKLAKRLEIELPPAAPPGYQPPEYLPEEAASEPEQAQPPGPATETADASAETSDDAAVNAEQASPAELAGQVESAAETSESPAESPEAARESAAAESTESEAVASETVQAPADAESATGDVDAADQRAEPSGVDEGNTPVEPGSESPVAATASSDEVKSAAPVPVPVPEPIRRPKPERANIEKCIKEWQVGSRRVHQLVNWLCDPFGDGNVSGRPPAVLTTMPSIKGLKQGDPVVGVVVGVMPFGVFVELAPDCSGLIHVSKVSDSFVEDVHEALQVGDVVTAWVTGIDDKRRRVALSAVSPEREAELREMKEDRDTRGGRGSYRGGERGDSRGQARGGQAGGGQGRPAEQRSGDARGKSGGPPRGGQRRDARGDSRGGRSRDTRGGKGRGREKKPETYRVTSSKPAAPISDAMKKGDEPLRSFGDLLQFYDKKDEPVVKEPAASSDSTAESPNKEVTTENVTRDATSQSTTGEETPQTGKSVTTTTQNDTPAASEETGNVSESADSASPPQSNETSQATDNDGGGEDKPSDQSAPTDASTS